MSRVVQTTPTSAAPAIPLRHQKKAELAYEHLREKIVNGAFSPGQRLTLADLSEQCNMSHMPVREALVRLQREGLIEGEPHKGMRVAGLSLKNARELFAIRTELEGLPALQACAAGDPTLATDLDSINREFARAFAARDYSTMGASNRAFHRRILRSAANSQLERLLEDLWIASLRYRMGYQLIPGRAKGTIAEHKRMVAAIRTGDPEKARAAARLHIERAAADLDANFADLQER